jgi:hypothetical protein
MGGNGRTKFVILKTNRWDYLVIITGFMFCLAIILLPWPAVRDILMLLGFSEIL